MARRFPFRLPLAVLAVVLVTVLTAPSGAPARPAASSGPEHPFQDPSLSVTARVNDLLDRLTLEEKLGLLHQSQRPIPRLGIPYFKAGTEALHGVAWSNDIDHGGTRCSRTAHGLPPGGWPGEHLGPDLVRARRRRPSATRPAPTTRSTRASGACRCGRRW